MVSNWPISGISSFAEIYPINPIKFRARFFIGLKSSVIIGHKLAVSWVAIATYEALYKSITAKTQTWKSNTGCDII